MASPVNFTDAAAKRVIELLEEEENPDLKLRVLVQGGGCSGLRYGFEFTETANDDDFVIEKSPTFPEGEKHMVTSVALLVDQFSMVYLKGATIDFKDDLSGTFVIRNPNAKTTCGCGSSFEVADDQDEK